MKYYLFGNKLLPVELEMAKRLGADIALAKKAEQLTAVYPLSDSAAQRFSELGLKDFESPVVSPAYIVVFSIEETVKFLSDKHGIGLEKVEVEAEQKTSQ